MTLKPIRQMQIEQCSNCGGYGLRMNGEDIGECSECGGGGIVEKRDARGRFLPWPIIGWYDPEAEDDDD